MMIILIILFLVLAGVGLLVWVRLRRPIRKGEKPDFQMIQIREIVEIDHRFYSEMDRQATGAGFIKKLEFSMKNRKSKTCHRFYQGQHGVVLIASHLVGSTSQTTHWMEFISWLKNEKTLVTKSCPAPQDFRTRPNQVVQFFPQITALKELLNRHMSQILTQGEHGNPPLTADRTSLFQDLKAL